MMSTELEFMMHVDGRRHVNMLPCDVCGIVLQCEWDYQQHIGGKRHRSALASQELYVSRLDQEKLIADR